MEKAAEAFKMARDSGNPVYRRRYLITIARIPGREIEAYEEAMRLFREDPETHRKLPAFRCLLFVLSTNPNLPEGSLRPTIDGLFDGLFPSRKVAYQDLYNYRQRVLEAGFYAGEIDRLMKDLIEELEVPDKWNPFIKKTTERIHFPNELEEYEKERRKGGDREIPEWMLKK